MLSRRAREDGGLRLFRSCLPINGFIFSSSFFLFFLVVRVFSLFPFAVGFGSACVAQGVVE